MVPWQQNDTIISLQKVALDQNVIYVIMLRKTIYSVHNIDLFRSYILPLASLFLKQLYIFYLFRI